jgi:putative protein kinase ArgK-like GTPase of G3E family
MTSALEGKGIHEFWEVLRLYMNSMAKTSQFDKERNGQNQFWLSWSLGITAHQLLLNHPTIQQKLNDGLSHIENHSASMFKAEYDIEEIMKSLIDSSGSNNN